MGWGDPNGPTTGDLERIDQALTDAGIPSSDTNGYPITLCARVNLALRHRDELIARAAAGEQLASAARDGLDILTKTGNEPGLLWGRIARALQEVNR